MSNYLDWDNEYLNNYEDFWRRSPLNASQVNNRVDKFKKLMFGTFLKGKKLPKDDLAYLSINYIFLVSHNAYAFELSFFVDDSDATDRFACIFTNDRELKSACAEFIKYYNARLNREFKC